MIEVTAEDIARLDDVQLRALVALLCEAEVRARGLSAACVTSGGDQNAGDGGVDVRVALALGTAIDGFVPRAATVFQVKRQDMPRRAILAEMRPRGILRQAIHELAAQGGAYIIVSSQGSTSDPVLQNRGKAMRDAVSDEPNAGAIVLDFYDRGRVATWVRSHPGLVPWVRALVGRPLQGWQSYGAWAPNSSAGEYILDEQLRLHPRGRSTSNSMSVLAGIVQLRDLLRQERSVVRLVGLSGVGKTRLVQALFDDKIGNGSLDPSIAIYTNMGDGPAPPPVALATNLALAGLRAVLVVDNCPPDLHQRLGEVCRQATSNLSLITVEFDVQDDQPEGTDAFELQPSSAELIESLLRQRSPGLSQVNRDSIGKVAGGNARIAIVLAEAVKRTGSIAGLSDLELFRRLFYQRQSPNEDLYLCAQACALVYSFQGEDVSSGEHGELSCLGNLINKTPQELYGAVAELQRRDIVQERGVWRAVLPQPLANRLATVALQNIPSATISEQLMSSERLLRSFARRLGYLHESKEGVRIVKEWLATGGYLGDVGQFNELGRTLFSSVAPAAPDAANRQRPPTVGQSGIQLLDAL